MHINETRQWLGSGYRAFWIDENTRYFFESFWWHPDPEGNQSDTFSGPSHAHSGYIDVYLELGMIGLTILALTIWSALAALPGVLRHNPVPGFLLALLLAFLLIYATAEGAILQQSDDLWFLFVLFYLFLMKARVFAPRSFKNAGSAGRPEAA